MKTSQVGFIGLGTMGWGMASQLYRAGMLTTVWNRTASRTQEFVKSLPEKNSHPDMLTIADKASSLAQQCNVIILCVSADNDVSEIITAIRTQLIPGSIIVDTSTIAATTAKLLATELAEQGIVYLDAPVSGGVEGARKGELVMMVGGDRQALEAVRPVLDCFTRQVSYFGESGAGQAAKAVNQIMAAGIAQAVTEALAFGEAMQLPMATLIETIEGGAAGNWFLSKRGKSMVAGEYAPGFKLALHKKDLDLCRTMAEQVSAHDMRLPIVEMTRLHYQRLIEQGHAEEDISALYRLKKQLFE